MSAIALGVFEDLKARRLLPVAIALFIALVAVPVLLLKPAGQQAAPRAAATAVGAAGAATSPATVNGLPGPEQALAGDKQLVSLAALDKASNLESFNAKNPFKPLQSLAKASADTTSSADTGTAATGGSATGQQDTSTGGGGTGGTPEANTPVTPTPTPSPNQPEKKLTYALDMTFQSPSGTRHLKSVPKLRMLPSEADPLLVFLGVDSTGTNAVFLVDATLKSVGGEGKCSPGGGVCATLTIEPGERQSFVNDQGEHYIVQIDEIRTVSVASVARAARLRAKKTVKTAVGSGRRFVPPLITDLLTGVQG